MNGEIVERLCRDDETLLRPIIAKIGAVAKEKSAEPFPPATYDSATPEQRHSIALFAAAVISAIEAIGPLSDGGGLSDLPRLIELQRTAAPDCSRDDGWNRGLERAAEIVREALRSTPDEEKGQQRT